MSQRHASDRPRILMEIRPPPPMLVDPAIDPREGAVGASLLGAEQLSTSVPGSTPPLAVELADIRALDGVGALQILIAEVREALSLVASSPLAPALSQPSLPGINLLEPALLDAVVCEPPPLMSLEEAEAAPTDAAPLSPLAVDAASVRTLYTALAGPPVQVGPATAPLAVIQMMLQRLPAEESPQPADWLSAAAQVEAAVRTALDKAVDVVTAWRDVPRSAVEVVADARTAVLAALDEDSQNPLWLMPEMMYLLPRMRRYRRLRRRLRRSLDLEEAIRSDDTDRGDTR